MSSLFGFGRKALYLASRREHLELISLPRGSGSLLSECEQIDHVIAYHPAWRGDASIIEHITRRGEGEAAEGGSQ